MQKPELIIIGGLPKAGKTTFVKQSFDQNKYMHICAESCGKTHKSAWSEMMFILGQAILKKIDVIFDSCGTVTGALIPSITMAKVSGFTTKYLYVYGSPCIDVDKHLLNKYKADLVVALPIFAEHVDKFIIHNG